jgi:hypothetical protein
MIVLPHRLDGTELRLRYGLLAELVVPRNAIRAARLSRRPEGKPGKVIVDGEGATFCCGETTVTLGLDPAVELSFRDEQVGHVGRRHVTVDDPHAFVTALSERAAATPR